MSNITNLTHINFIEKLPNEFKTFLKESFSIDCNKVCFKPQEGKLSEEAKIAMIAYKAWEVKDQESKFNLIRALTAESKLETLSEPTCVWDDNDPDGPTYHNLQELMEDLPKDKDYTLLNVGQSVQIDNTLMVLDHVKKSFTIVPTEAEGLKIIAIKKLQAARLERSFDVATILPKGVIRKKPKKKSKSEKV